MLLLYWKQKSTQKWEFSHYVLYPLPTESQVKFHGLPQISGALQENSVAAFSQKAEKDGDLDKVHKYI